MPSKNKRQQRTVLFVDRDKEHTLALCNAWSQLRLADELRVAESREQALEMLQAAAEKKDVPPVAAVVLDPEITGEDTGAFMRDVRKYCGGDRTPVVFWSRNGQQYEVLEGLARLLDPELVERRGACRRLERTGRRDRVVRVALLEVAYRRPIPLVKRPDCDRGLHHLAFTFARSCRSWARFALAVD